MKTSLKAYKFLESYTRIDEILSENDYVFEELDSIPSRDRLTFTNGFYVNCTALFVDIRDSSKLPDNHTRPVLAKLYRAYISEVVAIMNDNPLCAEVNIVGDCIGGIFDTKFKVNIDSVFETAAKICSLIQVLNYKLQKKGIIPIKIGIGMDYGRALMIKAGSLGSTINEVVWMGDVLNKASKLCKEANKDNQYFPNFSGIIIGNGELMVSKTIYDNLCDRYKALLQCNGTQDCHHGYIIDIEMDRWYQFNYKNMGLLGYLGNL